MDIKKELEHENRRLLFIKNHYKTLNKRNAYICKIINKLYSYKKYYPFVLSLIMSSITLKGVVYYDYEKNVITCEGLENTSATNYGDNTFSFTEPYYVLDDKQFYKQTLYDSFELDKINYYLSLSKEDLDCLLDVKKIYITTNADYLGPSYTTYEKHMHINEEKVLYASLECLFVTLFNFFILGLGDALFVCDYVNMINKRYARFSDSDLEMIDNYLYMIEENINALGKYENATRKRRVKQNS